MKALQLEKPHVIITIGIRGSGKTFFSQKFADTFNAPFVEQVVLQNAAKDTDAGIFLMQMMMKEIIKTGRSFLIELSLSSRTEREDLAKTLRKSGYTPFFVWVQTDLETSMARTHRSSGTTQQEYKKTLQSFEVPSAKENVLVISGKHTFATQAKAVLKKLSAPRQAARPTATESHQRPPVRSQIPVR